MSSPPGATRRPPRQRPLRRQRTAVETLDPLYDSFFTLFIYFFFFFFLKRGKWELAVAGLEKMVGWGVGALILSHQFGDIIITLTTYH